MRNHHTHPTTSRANKHRGNAVRATVEAMEPRRLMSYTPVGGDSLVNTYVTNSQSTGGQPNTIAADAAGNYVITWTSEGQDGSLSGIYARAFWANGTPRTGEFRVNQATAGNQGQASVAMESNGDFVITWSSVYTPPQSRTTTTEIFGRRYTAAATPLSGEFLVSGGNGGNQILCNVAMDQDGDFVATWCGADAMVNPTTSGGLGIIAQRFNQNGQKVGTSFRVNTTVPNAQNVPRVAMDAAGTSFVIAWQGNFQDGTPNRGIYAKRFGVGADGSLVAGAEVYVSGLPTNTVSSAPFIGMRPDGGQYTVGWCTVGGDGDLNGTFARRYDATGQALAAPFQVNTVTQGNQVGVQVAYDGSGNSIITWVDTLNTTAADVKAQAYDAQGNRDGGEFVLNGTTAGVQGSGHIAFQPGGGFVADFTNTVNGMHDVYARRFTRDAAAAPSSSLFSAASITTASILARKAAGASESQALLA